MPVSSVAEWVQESEGGKRTCASGLTVYATLSGAQQPIPITSLLGGDLGSASV